MSIFSNRMHCAMVNGKPIQRMEIPYNESCLFLVTEHIANIMDGKTIKFWKFPNEVANSESGVPPGARCPTWCTVFNLVHDVSLGSRSAA